MLRSLAQANVQSFVLHLRGRKKLDASKHNQRKRNSMPRHERNASQFSIVLRQMPGDLRTCLEAFFLLAMGREE